MLWRVQQPAPGSSTNTRTGFRARTAARWPTHRFTPNVVAESTRATTEMTTLIDMGSPRHGVVVGRDTRSLALLQIEHHAPRRSAPADRKSTRMNSSHA